MGTRSFMCRIVMAVGDCIDSVLPADRRSKCLTRAVSTIPFRATCCRMAAFCFQTSSAPSGNSGRATRRRPSWDRDVVTDPICLPMDNGSHTLEARAELSRSSSSDFQAVRRRGRFRAPQGVIRAGPTADRKSCTWTPPGGIVSTSVVLTDGDIRVGPTRTLVKEPVHGLIDARTAYDITRDGQKILMRQQAAPPSPGIRVIVNWMARLK